MAFQIDFSMIMIGFTAILLTVNGYFLKQSLDSIKEVQKCQIRLTERVSKIEGKFEAMHND